MTAIHFIYPPEVVGYKNILDAMVDPILEHLPEGVKNACPGEGLNVGFFTEPARISGCKAFIPHGIADKNYRTAKDVARYPHVFVSGPAWRDLYHRQGRYDGINIGGYTKLDPIFQGKMKKARKKKRPMILWAPTHGAFDAGRKPATSSWPDFMDYLDRIPDIEVALHPSQSDRHKATLQQLVDCSVVIADHGSLVYESLALGKPVIIPDWICKEGVLQYFPCSFEVLMHEQDICYHAGDIDELLRLIDMALDKGIDRKTQNFIDAIFPPDLRGHSGEATANILRQIARE